MHFEAKLTVLLDRPFPYNGPNRLSELGSFEAIGFTVVIGINAPDLAKAVTIGHDIAVGFKNDDGTLRSYSGVVTEAHVKRVEKTHWHPTIQQKSRHIDEEGAYLCSVLKFFSDEDRDGD